MMNPSAFLLFLIPLSVAVMGQVLFGMFSSSDIDVLSINEAMALEHSFQLFDNEAALASQGYLFALSMFALAITCSASIAASMFVVLQEENVKGKTLIGFFLIAIAISGLVFVFLTKFGSAKTTIDYLGTGVFKLTVYQHWEDMGFGLNLESWVDIANALGIGGAVFIALCICVLAPARPPDLPNDDEAAKTELRKAAKDLEARTQWLKHLLFAASTILIAAVANMQAWRHWPEAVLKKLGENEEIAKAYLDLADASIQYHAFMFVMILIAIFLPMAMWMQSSARQLSDKAVKREFAASPSAWRLSHGLTLSFSESAQRLIALLSPILVGPLMEIVKVTLNNLGG